MRRFPLDVLLVNDDPHNYTAATDCHRFLHDHPAVRSYGIASTAKALSFVRQGKVNTLLVSPGLPQRGNLDGMIDFIAAVESEHPRVVVVIYSHDVSSLVRQVPELESYFKLDVDELDGSAAAEDVLSRCEEWHETRFDYDIAMSFAGEDRQQAKQIATALKEAGVRVFYDQYEQANLLGKDLYVHLYEIYSKRSRYCVLLSSARYLEKMWAIHERRAAQERALQERGAEYILPIRLDDSEIPGIPSTIGHLSYASGPDEVSEALVEKLWLREPIRQKRYIGYSLYDYDATPLMRKVRRANYPHTTGLYVPPSWEYELIRDKEEADKVAQSAARANAMSALRAAFPDFVAKIDSGSGIVMDEVLPGLEAEEVGVCEQELGVPLPESYKQFLRAARGFWLSDGAVQFSGNHPYLHKFPDYESLSTEGKNQVAANGGIWPPPSDGMVCFAEYFEGDVGCSVLFDVKAGLRAGEYSVVYYYYRATPPHLVQAADSFLEWLNGKSLDRLWNL